MSVLQHEIKNLGSIPVTVKYSNGHGKSADAINHGIYKKFCDERTELQLHVEHKVGVYGKKRDVLAYQEA